MRMAVGHWLSQFKMSPALGRGFRTFTSPNNWQARVSPVGPSATTSRSPPRHSQRWMPSPKTTSSRRQNLRWAARSQALACQAPPSSCCSPVTFHLKLVRRPKLPKMAAGPWWFQPRMWPGLARAPNRSRSIRSSASWASPALLSPHNSLLKRHLSPALMPSAVMIPSPPRIYAVVSKFPAVVCLVPQFSSPSIAAPSPAPAPRPWLERIAPGLSRSCKPM